MKTIMRLFITSFCWVGLTTSVPATSINPVNHQAYGANTGGLTDLTAGGDFDDDGAGDKDEFLAGTGPNRFLASYLSVMIPFLLAQDRIPAANRARS